MEELAQTISVIGKQSSEMGIEQRKLGVSHKQLG
jgi:hypothetical protein